MMNDIGVGNKNFENSPGREGAPVSKYARDLQEKANELSASTPLAAESVIAIEQSQAAAEDELQLVSTTLAHPEISVGSELVESLEAIPDKMAFKIGEAADMVGVKQYVLRYWESEFDALKPRKSKNNQRVYSRKDVETALMIKKLLYRDRFSIEGARGVLKQLKTHVKEERAIKAMAQSQDTALLKLRMIASEIRRIRELF